MPDCIEIKQSYELKNNEPVYFKAIGGSHTFFHFVIDSPHILKIKTWPLDQKSEPDLYVTVD